MRTHTAKNMNNNRKSKDGGERRKKGPVFADGQKK